MKRIHLLSLALLCAASGRSEGDDPSKAIRAAAGSGRSSASPPAFPYDLARPALNVELPGKLEEISGLSFVSPGLLACVQDERATIYHVALPGGEVTGEFRFGGGGDFEGVEILGRDAWVLRSDGDLYEIRDYTRPDAVKEKHENALGKDNNVEGLGYDGKENRLLLASKDDPGEEGQHEGTRSVFAFDLPTKSLGAAPLYLIRIDDLDDGKAGDAFHPSGVAVHPLTGEIYVIASKGKRLVILTPGGKLKTSVRLPEEVFRQPEGICFSHSGDLFISNEAGGGKPNILEFAYEGEFERRGEQATPPPPVTASPSSP